MIGIDTTALIDLFNGDDKLIDRLQDFNEDVVLNMLVYEELIIESNPQNKAFIEEEKFYDEVFNRLNVLNLDKESIKLARNIYWDLKSKGKVIGTNDCLIAAIYLRNGVNEIITKNKKHFEKIKGLKVLSY